MPPPVAVCQISPMVKPLSSEASRLFTFGTPGGHAPRAEVGHTLYPRLSTVLQHARGFPVEKRLIVPTKPFTIVTSCD